ncbi:putative xyloglucan galactosyltransferase GT11 [Bienertia sinuspersici]
MNSLIFRCLKKCCFIVAVAIAFLVLCFALLDFEHISLYAKAVWQTKDIDFGFKPRIPTAAGEQKSEQESQQQDPCLGRYIYMHDLPAKFNKELVNKCETLKKQFNFCPYVKNGGFGSRFSLNDSSSETLSLGECWYATHQSILEMIFHTRMKEYECLTSNSSLASAIYAPFYPGLEVTQYLWGGFSSSVKDAGSLEFTAWLKRRPEWARMFGWDHFFVNGRITWDFRRPTYIGPKWGSKLMHLPETKNMTMLTVDSSPYANDDFAIPYPTDFHPSDDKEVLQWQERVRRAERVHLFAFAGATRRHSTSIRGELITQCKKASKNDRCKLISCLPNDKVNCRPDHVIKAFMKSDFCLQPSGDSGTRRSTFDAILAGCIPVFFHPGSAYTQYFWHLPQNYTSYSVFIPERGIKNRTVSVEEVLSQISRDAVTDMREEVIKLIPKVIYARAKLERTEDAFDIAIKRVLERIEDFRRQIQEGKNPRDRFPEKSTWKYYLTGETGKHEWDSFFQHKH